MPTRTATLILGVTKHGFCLFDNTSYRLTLPGAPSSGVYGGCGSAWSLTVTMGLSIGWGDTCPWYLDYQYIDITGLVAGRYRLVVTADDNNSTWADIQLRPNGNAVRVVAYGPAA